MKQALLDVARRKVLVSDSSKYGKYGMFRVCSLAALDDIICDAALRQKRSNNSKSVACGCTASTSDNTPYKGI
ncbi:Bacterial regulatory proteins, deoR family [Serratia fonticola]|uniref:Bacterial regulatory proteins, deoR family n=1 Tax=Serratia fonticola TaxID=47917 RepID=A0A4U9TM29_SERFO|nr:Bacterial regulatory proteins, deoR family [Serratia fonticola]